MIPDIEMVRKKAIDNEEQEIKVKVNFREVFEAVKKEAIEYFYRYITSKINNQLIHGKFAKEVLRYDEVYQFILRDLCFNCNDQNGAEIMKELSNRILTDYTDGGYTIEVERILIGVKNKIDCFIFKVKF